MYNNRPIRAVVHTTSTYSECAGGCKGHNCGMARACGAVEGICLPINKVTRPVARCVRRGRGIKRSGPFLRLVHDGCMYDMSMDGLV